MKPSDLRRHQHALREARRRLADDRAALATWEAELASERNRLDRERRAWQDERAAVVAALRLVCARHGSNEWADDDPLDEVLAEHLAEPLEELAARVTRRLRRLQAALDASTGPVAVPGRPPSRPIDAGTPAPEEHRVAVVRAETRTGSRGYRSVCTCGWSGAVVPSAEQAERLGIAHGEAPEGRRSS
jgi:hypothetical protein